jgi:hypothetical protein
MAATLDNKTPPWHYLLSEFITGAIYFRPFFLEDCSSFSCGRCFLEIFPRGTILSRYPRTHNLSCALVCWNKLPEQPHCWRKSTHFMNEHHRLKRMIYGSLFNGSGIWQWHYNVE